MKALQSGKFKVWALLRSFLSLYSTDKWQEGITGVIELKASSDDAEHTGDSCDVPEIVELMIEYFYHFDYLRTATTVSLSGQRSLIKHAKVFAMAIKYQVDGLRALALQKFQQAALHEWNSDDFAQVVHIVYTSTPDHVRELRGIVATTIYDHFRDLKDKEELEVVISGLGDLSYSLLRRTSSAFRCTKGHKDEATRISCTCANSTCAFDFDLCQQCHASRGSAHCPICNRIVRLP